MNKNHINIFAAKLSASVKGTAFIGNSKKQVVEIYKRTRTNKEKMKWKQKQKEHNENNHTNLVDQKKNFQRK